LRGPKVRQFHFALNKNLMEPTSHTQKHIADYMTCKSGEIVALSEL